MKVEIKVIRKRFAGGLERYVALFRGSVTPDEGEELTEEVLGTLPVVDLSRRLTGNCMYRVDSLHMHDHHAPAFDNLDGTDHTDGLNQYISRILDAINAGLSKGAEVITKNVEQIPNHFEEVEELSQQPAEAEGSEEDTQLPDNLK